MNDRHSAIAKNTIILYIRMGLNMLIGLYTSRLALQILGETSFGVYGVLTAIATFLFFLSGSLYTTATRFITFEIGKGNIERIRKTYGSIQYIILAAIILISEETAGIYYLHNKAVIPGHIVNAARISFQFCVLSSIFYILKSPAEIMVIANEKMDVFAKVNITENISKLILLLLLANSGASAQYRLPAYSAIFVMLYFMTCVLFNRFVIKNYLHEGKCSIFPERDNKILSEALSFFAADMYSSICNTAKSNGINLLQNYFFGPSANASALAAGQAQSGLMALADNFLFAVKPQLTKNYAEGNTKELNFLILWGTEIAALLFILIIVPMYLEADFIIKLWLGSPPPYVSVFLRIMIITMLYEIVIQPIGHTIMSTGKIKKISFFYGTAGLASFICTGIAYKLGFPVQSCYICVLICTSIAAAAIVFLAIKQIPAFNIFSFLKLIVKIVSHIVIIITPAAIIYNVMQQGWLRLIAVCFTSTALWLIVFLCFAFDKNMRIEIRQKIQYKIKSYF